MNNAKFTTPIDQRYFEDYVQGETHEWGSIVVDEAAIIAFAKQFDPQPFHLDPGAAKRTIYGGLIASGWHTVCLTMRVCVEHYLSRVASLGSPGVDEIRWLKPVYAGDSLSFRVTIVEAKRSNSKPDRGVVHSYIEALNQSGEIVMTMKGMNLIRCRNST